MSLLENNEIEKQKEMLRKMLTPNFEAKFNANLKHKTPETIVKFYVLDDIATHDMTLIFEYDNFSCSVGYNSNMDLELTRFQTHDLSRPISMDHLLQNGILLNYLAPDVKEFAQRLLNKEEINKSNIIT